MAFADASDEFLLHVGFGAHYREVERGSFYTVETYTRFLRELKLGDVLEFDTTVLGADAKRLHLFHSMRHGEDGYEAATQEVMMLHVDLDTTSVRPMSGALVEAIGAVAAEHAGLERASSVGRGIRGVTRRELS